jgi:hypothetical protein
MTFPVNAGSEKSDLLQPINFWAGEAPIITSQGSINTTVDLPRGTILELTDGSRVAPIAAGTTLSDAKAMNKVILAQDVIGNASTQQCPYYVGGFFNHEALSGWPTAAALYDNRREMFTKEIAAGTIKIGKLI